MGSNEIGEISDNAGSVVKGENHAAKVLKSKKLDPVDKMVKLYKEIEKAYKDANPEGKLESAKVKLNILKELQSLKERGDANSQINNGIQLLIPVGFDKEGKAIFQVAEGNSIGQSK